MSTTITNKRKARGDSKLDALPPEVDPCGENGEFHTFAYDGPMFATSVAVTVVTAIAFSTTLTLAEAPPPSLVMTGLLSLTAVTVTAMACVSVFAPSLTFTITS